MCRRHLEGETSYNDKSESDVHSGEDVFVPAVSDDHDYGVTMQQEDSQLDAAQIEIKRLQAEVESLREERSFVTRLSKDDSLVTFYTGFPSYVTLMAFFQCIEPTASTMTRYSQHRRLVTNSTMYSRIFAPEKYALPIVTQFLLVLRKLRVGNLDKELADIHGISTSTTSRIVLSWVNYLYVILGSMPLWPSRQTVNAHMPDVFKDKYAATRVILDCTEIHVQRPSSLRLNTEFYSHYKSTTTLKALVGITPSGAVSFVSALHPGSVSDNAITRNSGILDLLEKGDQVMVDKGFTISADLAKVGATLVIPPFLTAARSQFTQQEVTDTQSIARVRVHVERAIRRVKCYHFFDRVVPLTFAGSINQMWTVCCLLTNFRGCLLQTNTVD